ncbi:MAG: 50S ribosomal protein L1 [Methanocellales archaeon]
MIDRKEIERAVKEVLEKSPKRNFNESIDLAINLKDIDMSKPKNRIDESIILPSGCGRERKIGIFARGDTALKAEKAGVNLIISPEEIPKLGADKKKLRALIKDIDIFIAEASLMPAIGKNLGSILAPRGKMPEPIPPGSDIQSVIERLRKTVRIRSKDRLTFHTSVGVRTMNVEELVNNIEAVLKRIESKLERGMQNVKSIYLKTTMGQAVRVI